MCKPETKQAPALKRQEKGGDNMTIRLEKPEDWSQTEELTREAFWNRYRPGCSEHYILHRYRSRPDFIKELDYVIEESGQLVAHIMYSRSEILQQKGGRLPSVTFGPVSVLPAFQGRGYGSSLIRFTLEKARELGFGAVAITGNPDYYHRFGFCSGQLLGIQYARAAQGEETPCWLVRELLAGLLKGVAGTFTDPEGYDVNEQEVEAFDKRFPFKEKLRLPGQLI